MLFHVIYLYTWRSKDLLPSARLIIMLMYRTVHEHPYTNNHNVMQHMNCLHLTTEYDMCYIIPCQCAVEYTPIVIMSL